MTTHRRVGRQLCRGLRPRVEGLEARGLMAVAIQTFPIATGFNQPMAITLGPDHALWFTDFGADAIGRVDPATHAIVEFHIPSGGGPFGITSGPDKALWFTEDNGRLGRIDPTTHRFQEFVIPAPGGALEGIATGSDGALWFAESNLARAIGRFDPTTHAYASFPISLGDRDPSAITSGPDGALWFTASSGGVPYFGPPAAIGRIDPTTHAIASFPLEAHFFPSAITSGPDGALWFTEVGEGVITSMDRSRIARIDPTTHAINQFPIPTVGSDPTGIATGPDGALWFTEARAIGRLDPAIGAISEYPVAVPAGNSSITRGPGSTLWFTEFAGGRIGRIDVSPPVATPPTVVSLKRYGFHRQPTTLVLAFSTALDPARAEDAGNYRIIAPNGRTIAVDSASYDPGTRTVTLRPHMALNVHRSYRLIVTGTGPGGVAGPTGILLDGAGNGKAGSDYVATVDRSTLVIPARGVRA